MAVKQTKYQKLQRKYVKKTNSLYSKDDGKEVLSMLEKGQNSYLKLNRFESSSMDMSWIKRIEDCIPELGEIIGNPKKTIQTLNEVVLVEKVKKIGTETVQHLASHTQFIKQIDENGNVTPSKLLNVYVDDFYAIYENKFIATLLRHLIVFVEKRYEFILKSAKMSDVTLLYAKNHTEVEDNVIDIETKVRYSRPADFVAADRMKGYLKQIRDIRKYLKFYMHSEFMNILRREKDVRNPILQTNIIRKNPKYHKCYLLWLFIERYRESGIEVKVEENYADLSQEEINEINQVMCANFLTLKGKDIVKSKKKQKVYKPKILNTYDDVIYKPAYFDGPVEFVRVDAKYREYSEALHDIPAHPTAAIKEYEKEKYAENKANREKTKQIDALLKRKPKEQEIYEKGEAQAEAHEKERDEWIDAKAEQIIRQEALAEVEKARKKLVNQAKKEKAKPAKKPSKPKVKKEPQKAKPVKKDEPKKEEAKIVEVKPEPKPEPKVVEKKEPKKSAKKVVKKVTPKKPKEAPKKKAEIKKVAVKKAPAKKAEPKKEKVAPKPVKKETPKPKKAVAKKPAKKVEPKPVQKEEPKPVVKPEPKPVVSKPAPKAKPKKEEKPEKFKAIGTYRSKKK